MKEALKTVLSLSLSGTLLISVLYLLRPIFRERFSRQWQYYIWLVVIARLLLPVALDINLMEMVFQNFKKSTEQTESIPPVSEGMAYEPETNNSQSSDLDGSQNSLLNGPAILEAYEANPVQSVLFTVWNNLWICWLMMACILLIRKITIYQSFVKYIKAGSVEIADIELLEQFGRILEKSKINKNIELYTNSLISSPLLIGFFRPCIVLPCSRLPSSEFQYTILHELTHYRRLDMLYKWLVQLAICVHWFNPAVYLMSRTVSQACELSCDEAVIKTLGPQERRAYGDTLLSAMVTGGTYKSSIASVTLHESKELLKERLDAIMKFKKKNRLTAAASLVLALILCFGASVTGAYAAIPLSISKVNDSGRNSSKQPGTSEKPKRVGNLSLVEKEYTMDELKTLDISGVAVEALSEDVSVVRGGDTLKLEYYTANKKDYTLKRENDGGKTRWNLCLKRMSASTKKDVRSVTITIPDDLLLKTIKVTSGSGNISFKDCTTDLLLAAESKTGSISINGGSPSGWFIVNTESGNALISDVTLPESKYDASFETKSGTISLQPKDGVNKYHFILDTGEAAQITVNGKKYRGGDFEINPKASKNIYFDSVNGALIAQDLSKGKLTAAVPMKQADTLFLSASDHKDLKHVRKVFTESDLKKMGIEGLRVKTKCENIVVQQGKDSLILEYDQKDDTEYALKTKNYELYNEEYLTDEELASKNGKSGQIKELVLQSSVKSAKLDRTIYITLPAGTQYSRVVQLLSNTGSIQMSHCKTTDMLSAETKAGNILAQSCNTPCLGLESKSGQIEASGCKTNQLNTKAISGTLTLKLPDRAANYKMVIDTGSKSRISINGKEYSGGERVLNKKALKEILFDSNNGTLIITEQ